MIQLIQVLKMKIYYDLFVYLLIYKQINPNKF